MLLADPDAPESPLGRTTRGVLVGVVITALVAAGSLVYGLMSPGGNGAWRASGTLVVNRETGARYVYVGGRLRPVRNYASALLVGDGKLKSEDVSTSSLKGTAVGAPVGIPGAPDSVPGVQDLEKDPWQVCSVLASEAGAGTGVRAVPPAGAVRSPRWWPVRPSRGARDGCRAGPGGVGAGPGLVSGLAGQCGCGWTGAATPRCRWGTGR